MERVQSRQIVGNEVSAKGPRGKPVERASAARCLTTPDPEKTHGRSKGVLQIIPGTKTSHLDGSSIWVCPGGKMAG